MRTPEVVLERIRELGGFTDNSSESDELAWGCKTIGRVCYDAKDGFTEDLFFVVYDDGEVRELEIGL